MGINYTAIAMKYRQGLLERGKEVNFKNPDRLSLDQLQALTEKIFREVDSIDMQMGYPHHDTGLRRPASVTETEQQELFIDFIDWYQIIRTPSQDILEHVLANYPKDKYPRILCVGDGKPCHLGRKLAMKGYKVISVDPVARKEFAGKMQGEDGGSLRILTKEFSRYSESMIDWASVIVGTKVPECAEDLVHIDSRPVVFNVSNNPEMYNMKFNGVPVTSGKQFVELIRKASGVEVIKGKDEEYDKESVFFVRDVRTRKLEDKDDGECK